MPNRDINKLNPQFKKKVELFMKEVGDKVFITEGWRSYERQKELYAQGRTKPGRKVTWTMKSKHLDGNAIDIAFLGKDLYPKDDKKWEEVFDTAERFGIVSLYRKIGRDRPHLENNGRDLDSKEDKMTEKEKKLLVESIMRLNSTLYNHIDDEAIKQMMSDINTYFRDNGFEG